MCSPAIIITEDPTLAGYLPKDFLIGCASASYQIEGCTDVGGKGEGLWDTILADKKGDNGEDACNSYEDWEKDLDLVESYGGNCYRLSIAWPRIIPKGGRDDPINEEGVQYYNKLIDALIARGIEPVVTIFHWDHPQALEERYGGFWNESEIIADFVNYSKVLFERFGDRVTKWITFNEPHIFTMRMSMLWGRERFNVHKDYTRLARTITLLHAYSVDLYRRDFQPDQNGTIGITLNIDWNEPLDDTPEAKEAAELTIELILGLYADPIFVGEYTERLKKEYGSELPHFSDAEKQLVKGSSDFFGLNHYCTAYTTGRRFSPEEAGPPGWLWSFGRTEKVYEKDGKPIGTPGLGGHLCSVPWGFRKNLVYIHERYLKTSGVAIWITENGFPRDGEADMPLAQRLEDTERQQYFAGYLRAMLDAMREDGVKIGGYMAWSLLDNLEWERGYKPRFGLTVVERDNGFKRHPKKSAYMLRDIYKYLLGK